MQVKLLRLSLSHFSCVRLCATPETAARLAPCPWDSPGKNTGVGCHFLLQCMKMKSKSEVAQSYPTLSDPWTAAYQAPPSMGFSRQEYWSGLPLPSPKLLQLYPTLCNPMDYTACQTPLSMGFSRQQYWSELPCPPSRDISNLGIEPTSLICLLDWQARSLRHSHRETCPEFFLTLKKEMFSWW